MEKIFQTASKKCACCKHDKNMDEFDVDGKKYRSCAECRKKGRSRHIEIDEIDQEANLQPFAWIYKLN